MKIIQLGSGGMPHAAGIAVEPQHLQQQANPGRTPLAVHVDIQKSNGGASKAKHLRQQRNASFQHSLR